MRYEVTSFDVCQSGFERLRNQDEFILVGYVQHDTGKADLLGQFLDDIQSCGRPGGFDYDAAKECVWSYMRDVDMKKALAYVDAPPDMDDDSEEEESSVDDESEYGCSAFLYIRDTQHDSNIA